MDRPPIGSRTPRLKDLNHAIPGPIAIEETQVSGLVPFVLRITTPIPANQVRKSVAIEITGGHTRPKPWVTGHPPGFGGLAETRSVIDENADRTPFGGHHQVAIAIPVEVHRAGSGSHADGRKRGAAARVHHQSTLLVQPPLRGHRFGIPGRPAAATDPDIQIPIAIHIHADQGSDGIGARRQRLRLSPGPVGIHFEL